jgi:parallel beta-helix repeat protein
VKINKKSTFSILNNLAIRIIQIAISMPARTALFMLGIVSFGVIGSTFLMSSHAATPNSNFEAETGTLSGCAKKVSDSYASGSQAVQFGTCSNGPINSPLVLDGSGKTVPDSSYPIPTGAIFMSSTGSDVNTGTISSPIQTFNKAIDLIASGGTIVIRGGTYRDWYNNGAGSYKVATKTMTIQAYPHEQVWFDGTDVAPSNNWVDDGAGHWYVDWNTPSFCSNGYYNYKYDAQPTLNTGPCSHFDVYGDPAYLAAGDPQMVYIDGQYVYETNNLSGVSNSRFFYDWSAKRMYIGTNPIGHKVELAARPIALQTSAPNVNILGIGVRRYATNEYSNATIGAFYIGGANSLVENSAFVQNAGGGLYMQAQGGHVNHTVLALNGYTSMGSNGHQHSTGIHDGLVVENSLIDGNNREHYGVGCSVSCGSAGIKIAHMDGFTIKNNIFQNNVGKAGGFWCDLACTGAVIINNISRNNGDVGLFYEVSSDGIIASNLVYGNGGYGIRVASATTKIYNNTLVDNTGYGGIWVYDDTRSYGVGGWTDVGPDTQHDEIVNNIISDSNGQNSIISAQGKSTSIPPNTTPSQFFDAYDYNSYFRSKGVNEFLLRWITPMTDTHYNTIATVSSAFGFDTHSTDATAGIDPFFIDPSNANYIVRSRSPAYHSATTLPDDVAAALGLNNKTGYSRGAISWPGQ